EGISYTTGHTDHVVGNFTSCSFPVVTLAQQHRTDIVRTEGPVVVDRPLQVDVVSGIGSFTKGNQLLFRTFDRVTESVIRIVDVGQEKLLRLSGLHGSGGTGRSEERRVGREGGTGSAATQLAAGAGWAM